MPSRKADSARPDRCQRRREPAGLADDLVDESPFSNADITPGGHVDCACPSVMTRRHRRRPYSRTGLTDSLSWRCSCRRSGSPFVLHDVFGRRSMISPDLDRSPAASRQLASRPRMNRNKAPATDRDCASSSAFEAFVAAVRDGDFERLVAVLDPDIVLRSDAVRSRARHGSFEALRPSLHKRYRSRTSAFA